MGGSFSYPPFLSQELLEVKGIGALSLSVPFDEKSTLEKNAEYLVRSLEVSCSISCDSHMVVM